jgi:hypothetical protein
MLSFAGDRKRSKYPKMVRQRGSRVADKEFFRRALTISGGQAGGRLKAALNGERCTSQKQKTAAKKLRRGPFDRLSGRSLNDFTGCP